jgi:NTE family protein
MLSRPDILVLGGGGVLGRAWMTGALAGIEDVTGFDLSRCEYFVGTSAGAVIGAQLAAGVPLERPRATSTELDHAGAGDAQPVTPVEVVRRAAAWTLATTSPMAPLALNLARPAGALLRALVLRAVGTADGDHSALRAEVDAFDGRFDGRLRITAVDYRRGQRIVFGSPGAPFATVTEAVEASCAIPGVYPPVLITGREYVDGGVWSPSNLDVAPAHRGSHVLCLNPLSTAGGSRTRPIRRSLVTSALAMESLALRGRGAEVLTVSPDPDAVAAIGPDLMDRRPRAEVLAAGYQQGRTLASSGWVVRAR